jgi:conjugative relaxase-like TrwC/TraI family protein
MLRMIQNTSSAGAKSYYSTADYYSEGQELEGFWRGQGAARLGLSGRIERDAWDALCDNRNPATGKALTQRRKDERRVGYDFNFHVPKSVSVLYGLTKDERILDAFRASVDETMHDMEAEMKTRVRVSGKNEDRTTGNMVWGEFIHTTARPVDGVPDPHLHAHCFVFNTTFDEKENRWKAGQFGDLKRDAPFFEAVFHSRMARRLADLGLPTVRSKTGWEIEGIASSALDKFSRRTALIEEKAKELGVTDAKEKEGLGATTREHKRKDLSLDELRTLWAAKMSGDEMAGIERATGLLDSPSIAEDNRAAGDAVTAAAEHHFERKSVVPERILLATALKRSVGKASIDSVEREFKKQDLVIAEREGRRWATTPEVLAEETRMIKFARDGRGSCQALNGNDHVFKRDWLNRGQVAAVLHVLNSRDRVILIRGAAGVGKTAMMSEAVEGIEAGGKKVFTFAPSADASRGVLRQEGFKDAETVARLLADEKLQQTIAGQVIWIDEAGLLGTRQMGQVFDLANKIDARVVMSGDRRQHGSVERGAALRLLETEAGVLPVELKDIQRQQGTYKQAVQALSEGRTEAGFRQLDELGWVREVPELERYKVLAGDYLSAVNTGKSALVVSPTHLEGERITDEIRSDLRRTGKLGKDQRQFRTFENANLTLGERRDELNYVPGDLVVFHQNAKGFQRGERVVVGDAPLPLDQAGKFHVFHPDILPLASGDVIRITHNGKTADGEHRLNNGAIYKVKGFTKDGDIQLSNGWTISKDFGHFTYGYCVTSHASQGKTVDRVFIGQSSTSFPASSREQFYVSVSRGKEQATIYTSDKQALREAVGQTDERISATELVAAKERQRRMNMERREQEFAAIAATRTSEGRRREEIAYER